jgi:F5/8 type C domain
VLVCRLPRAGPCLASRLLRACSLPARRISGCIRRHERVSGVLLVGLLIIGAPVVTAAPPPTVIHIDTAAPTRSFTPGDVLGAGVDGLREKRVARVYQPGNIREMGQIGFRRLSYRLRTELGVEAWHWNEVGTWSVPQRQQGYWTSDATGPAPIRMSHGYRLPRRGNTIDQANNDGYSRLDDGDEDTFWKSNPYLEGYFTHEPAEQHPQWVVIDLGSRKAIGATRILWGEPYAVAYRVQYWKGKDRNYLNDLKSGSWQDFPHGVVTDGKGGDVELLLGPSPIRARYMRLLLLRSSETPSTAPDIRDRLGFAIREIFAGSMGHNGQLRDVVRHGISNAQQTVMWTSSTDPWHRSIDLDPKTEQPGFDRVFATGLTHGLPMLTPVGILYDTPDNAVAEVRFFKARGYSVKQIELGEEPDGQNVTPEDYATLFIQFADAIHRVDPAIKTGGPSLQSEIDGWTTLADKRGDRSWIERFLRYLRSRRHLGDLSFFSFEWYPADDVCGAGRAAVASNIDLMKRLFRHLEADGVPRTIPWILSEYGYSSFATEAEVEMPAAVLNAEIFAEFLMLGGTTAYVYGIEPGRPSRGRGTCKTWGNLMMFRAADDGRVEAKMPIYYAARLLAKDWIEPMDAKHTLYRTSVGDRRKGSRKDISAFALLRPDGQWAILLLNNSASKARAITIRFDGIEGQSGDWRGPLEVLQYSGEQYKWRANGASGKPVRSEPPKTTQILSHPSPTIELPAMSITVARGVGPQPPGTTPPVRRADQAGRTHFNRPGG